MQWPSLSGIVPSSGPVSQASSEPAESNGMALRMMGISLPTDKADALPWHRVARNRAGASILMHALDTCQFRGSWSYACWDDHCPGQKAVKGSMSRPSSHRFPSGKCRNQGSLPHPEPQPAPAVCGPCRPVCYGGGRQSGGATEQHP